jgi:alkanesulfonate monooxygenase SsuD/methylene tetrahydromethanopterin reductase-like flavin-dependent oxidoreductase (luciferase family)
MVDKRHDLAFDSSESLREAWHPNAQRCHADKSAQWAADAIERWQVGPESLPELRRAFRLLDHRADARAFAMVAASATAPAIARASALSELYSGLARGIGSPQGLADRSNDAGRSA